MLRLLTVYPFFFPLSQMVTEIKVSYEQKSSDYWSGWRW